MLTIGGESDRIYESPGAEAHAKSESAALNLENDTEQETQNYDSNSE